MYINTGKKSSVASKIAGVVYTDMIGYILPGFFLIIGTALISIST